MPGGGCDPVGGPVESGGPCFQAGAACPGRTAPRGMTDPCAAVVGGTHVCSRCGWAAARESGPTLGKFTESCLPWEGPHSLMGEGLFFWRGGRKSW